MNWNSLAKLNGELLWGILKGVIVTRSLRATKPVTLSVRGRPMTMRLPSFIHQYLNIFRKEEYALSWSTPSPRILDLGANVGMSVLFYKLLFPGSAITAFEADPEIFDLLRRNCDTNNLSDIELHNRAAWVSDGTLAFHRDGLGGGSLAHGTHDSGLKVQAVDMRLFLRDREFDIVKIDIEGAEGELIPHIIDVLRPAARIVFEYHSLKGQSQALGHLLGLLEKRGYRLYLRTEDRLSKPFQNELPGAFDNRIVVYCTKS